MSVRTCIQRVKSIPYYVDGYEIKLLHNGKEMELFNPREIREEFWFGKHVRQISSWIRRRLEERYKEWGEDCSELYDDEIFDEYLYIDDLEDLLSDIKKVLERPELAKEVLPYPEDTVFIVAIDEDGKDTRKTGDALYDESYMDDLKRAKEILEKLIDEDKNDDGLIVDYIVDVG